MVDVGVDGTLHDRNFPCLNLTTGPNMPDTDLEAYMTGVYGSSPGCLCTFDNEVRRDEEENEGAGRPLSVCCTICVSYSLCAVLCVLHGVYRGVYCARVCAILNHVCVYTNKGFASPFDLFDTTPVSQPSTHHPIFKVVSGKRVAQIATTIAGPGRGYAGTYNYFDPDNFISLSAMIYSGNRYLQEQARAVVERSGAFLKPNGQVRREETVPHVMSQCGTPKTRIL